MKVIEVVTEAGHLDTVKSIAQQFELIEFWHGATDEDGRMSMRILVQPEQRQRVMDNLQGVLSASEVSRIIIFETEAVWPYPQKDKEEKQKSSTTITREELYNKIEQGAKLDGNFLLLVLLSTIVVAIGLIANNVAVVIGAMVIAPLLGPNIALALSTALGDRILMWSALKSNMAGVGLAFTLSILLGMYWTGSLNSAELMSRTYVGLDGVVLALASGFAAALSLTTGLSSVLVGVMVAVALLPPTATAGIMLGAGKYELATGSFLLLAVNVVCVNLSANIVFLLKGVRPRTWLEKKKARQSYILFLIAWISFLLILTSVIVYKFSKPV